MIRKTMMVAALASSALILGTAQAQFFGGNDQYGTGNTYGSGDGSGRGAGTGSGSGDFEMNVKAKGNTNMDARGDFTGNSNMYGGGYGAPYYPPYGGYAPYGYGYPGAPMMAPPFAPPAPPAMPAR